MNIEKREIIKNRIKEIKNKKKSIFYKGIKKYNYFKFKKKLN